jgi:hypothetical protein
LHDTSLHHFFEGIYRRKLRDLDRYVEVMRRYYGREGTEAALRNFASRGRQNDQMAVRFPLTEHALEGARESSNVEAPSKWRAPRRSRQHRRSPAGSDPALIWSTSVHT